PDSFCWIFCHFVHRLAQQKPFIESVHSVGHDKSPTRMQCCLRLVFKQSLHVQTPSSLITFEGEVAQSYQNKLHRCVSGWTAANLYISKLISDLLDQIRAGSSPARSTPRIAGFSGLETGITWRLTVTHLSSL